MAKKFDYDKELANQRKTCSCEHLHVPWYHEPLEPGRTYVAVKFDEFGIGIQTTDKTAYWAHVQKMANGYATCLCSDGKTRVLPTPVLTHMVRTRPLNHLL